MISLLLFNFSYQKNFLNEQKKHERVRAAIKDKGNKINELLSKNDLSLTNLNILFVAYKEKAYFCHCKEKK